MSEERSLENLLKDTPQEKLDWLVSMSDLSEVARSLSKWHHLAPHLHITQEQEKEIVFSCPSDLELQKLRCLQKWSHDQYFKATYRTLIQALYKVKNLDLIDEICKLLKTKSCPSPPPQTTLQQYAQELRVSYSSLMPPPIFQALAGDDEDGPSPSEKFINLVMTSRERVQRERVDDQHMRMALQGNVPGMANLMSERKLRVPVELRDIFTLDRKTRKVILIEGAPGSGKTTLFWHICQRWSARELFSQFILVLLVKLRDPEVQKAKCLADILPFADEKEKIAKKIMHLKGKGVLLLFDGWDELPENLQRDSLFQILMKDPHKHSLQNTAVVVSARQITSASLQQNISTRIEILGFTPDQIETYVKTSLESQPQAASSLMTKIKQDPNLQGNCYLPLSMAIITHIFMCMGHALPATFCQIIEELALSCLFRHIKKHKPYGHLYKTLYSFDDLQTDMHSQLNTMCERAYNSLLRSQYCFSDTNTPTLGLMQSVQSFVVRGKSTQHYFLHMSLHELCAAKYLVTLPEELQSSLLDDVLMGKVSQMTNVLSFYSAFGGWMSIKTKEVLVKHVQNLQAVIRDLKSVSTYEQMVMSAKKNCEHFFERRSYGERMARKVGTEEWKRANPVLMMIYSVYESQNPELCQILPSEFETTTLPFTIREWIALSYIILHKKFEALYVQASHDCNLLGIISPALKRNMPEYLALLELDIKDEGVSVLADAIIGTCLKGLEMNDCKITERGAKLLSNALCHSRIERLVLSIKGLGDAGLNHFVSNLTKIPLHTLALQGCTIGDEGVIFLSRALPRTNIANLNICFNHISPRGLKALGEAVVKCPIFHSLIIDSPSIETEGIKKFLITVANHPTLRLLIISERSRKELSDTIRIIDQGRKRLGHVKLYIHSVLQVLNTH